MVDTGWKTPGVVTNENRRTPHWSTPWNVQGKSPWGGAAEGVNPTGQPAAQCLINYNAWSDGLIASSYGFNIPKNARIDGIQVRVLRSGPRIVDGWLSCWAYDHGLANKAKGRQRTDWWLLYDYYGSSSDKWGSTSLTPSKLNNGFAVVWAGYKTTSGSGWHNIFVMDAKVDYTNPTYSITSNLPPFAIQGSQVTYKVTIQNTNNIDQQVAIPVEIPIPDGFTFVSATSAQGSYDPVTELWTPILGRSTRSASVIMTLEATTLGEYSQVVTENDFSTTITKTCEVLATDPSEPYYREVTIDDPLTLANLQDGEQYTLAAYSKVHDTALSDVFQGVRNNKITVINGETVYGSRVETLDSYERVSVTFEYDSNEDLVLRLYGQYQSISTSCTDEWAGFTLKAGIDDTFEGPDNLLADPAAMLDDLDFTTVIMPEGQDSANYHLQFEEIAKQSSLLETIFTGLELHISVDTIEDIQTEATLTSTSGTVSATKSVVYPETTDEIVIGSQVDRWDLDQGDIALESLNLDIKFRNLAGTEVTASVKNAYIILYYNLDETQGSLGFTYDGEHSVFYQLLLLDMTDPAGLKQNIETLSLPRMDGELVTNQSIKTKEVSLQFVVWGDTLEEARSKLDDITSWLSNERNEMFIPVPKSLIFDTSPTVQYNAILAEPITTDINYTSILCQAKFIIPEGVAYDVTPTITGSVGRNEGLVKVRPVIEVLCSGGGGVEITDSESDQRILLNANVPDGVTILIDCDDRTILGDDSEDYTEDVSVDTVWFNFLSDYNLTCVGGTIQSVKYYQGR